MVWYHQLQAIWNKYHLCLSLNYVCQDSWLIQVYEMDTGVTTLTLTVETLGMGEIILALKKYVIQTLNKSRISLLILKEIGCHPETLNSVWLSKPFLATIIRGSALCIIDYLISSHHNQSSTLLPKETNFWIYSIMCTKLSMHTIVYSRPVFWTLM